MGQKTHPLGFRLGITQKHKSLWYANFNQYANILEEDDKIRTYINSIAKTNAISNVQINRNGLNDQIQLNIETGKPGILVGDFGTGFENLLTNIKKILPSNRQLIIKVFEVEKVDLNASLLGDLVVEQLEKRIAFRRAIREALQRAQKQNVNGIKIQVSGRLNGADIARSEWIREGRVPLQTLRADMDYATKEANTIYGILGIKVWLFKGEKLKTKTSSINIEELKLSTRVYNCLKKAQINTIGDLLQYSLEKLQKLKNFGQKSADEVFFILKDKFGIILK